MNDYAPGRYAGALTPGPPHADLNPKKAVVVAWKDSPCKFVFSHEASYCPYLELPDGSRMGNQLFEGNLGDAEFGSRSRAEWKSSSMRTIGRRPDTNHATRDVFFRDVLSRPLSLCRTRDGGTVLLTMSGIRDLMGRNSNVAILPAAASQLSTD